MKVKYKKKETNWITEWKKGKKGNNWNRKKYKEKKLEGKTTEKEINWMTGNKRREKRKYMKEKEIKVKKIKRLNI